MAFLSPYIVSVSYEQLSKIVRNSQKIFAFEYRNLEDKILSLLKSTETNRDIIKSQLNKLVDVLLKFKQKLNDLCSISDMLITSSRNRFHYIDKMDFTNEKEIIKLEICDYLLRKGYYNCAQFLAEKFNILSLFDWKQYLRGQKIENALKEGEVSLALAWCGENRSKLKRLSSSFEFHLHLKHLIYLIKKGSMQKIFDYLNSYLYKDFYAIFGDEMNKFITAILCFNNDENICSIDAYSPILSSTNSQKLIEEFNFEYFRVNGINSSSFLEISIFYGLSSIKTPICNIQNDSSRCPTCSLSLYPLTKCSPFSSRGQTVIICRASGELIHQDNPLLVLPNGEGYSKNVLEKMARENNGYVKCPMTEKEYPLSLCRNAYVI